MSLEPIYSIQLELSFPLKEHQRIDCHFCMAVMAPLKGIKLESISEMRATSSWALQGVKTIAR
jgi:hypothetical protein